MKNASELLEEVVYAGNLSENEEERLYSWIESLILAKRKADEYEAKAKAFDRIVEQRKKTGVITLGHHAWHIIKKYESGEYDA